MPGSLRLAVTKRCVGIEARRSLNLQSYRCHYAFRPRSSLRLARVVGYGDADPSVSSSYGRPKCAWPKRQAVNRALR
jgi:hypothetical protein